MQPDPRLASLREALDGQVLTGSRGARYFLREVVGEGGQGLVFKARCGDPEGSIVIIKVCRPDVVSAETLSRFQREADVLRLLSKRSRPSEHIVRFHDHAVHPFAWKLGAETIPLPFTVLEYVDGPTLKQLLANSRGVRLPLERSRRILGHIALALEHVHAQDVVHRDLKPSNILLAHEGGEEVAKVTDFGIVKLVRADMQRTATLAGASLGYAPPEQYEQGNPRVSARTDLFSFAAIAFELLTGKLAFPYKEGENPLLVVTRLLNTSRPQLAKSRDGLPPELSAQPDLIERFDAQIGRALMPDPADRHGSITELWRQLDPLFRATSESRAAAAQVVGRATTTPSHPTYAVAAAAERDGGMLRPGSVATTLVSAQDPASPRHTPTPAESRAPEARLANPAAWTWSVRTRAIGPSALRAVEFTSGGDSAVGITSSGVVRWDGRNWSPIACPPGIDIRKIRGVLALAGEGVLVYGDRGFAARVEPRRRPEIWNVGDRGVQLLGAHVDGGNLVTLVGERQVAHASGGVASVGVIAQVVDGRPLLVSDVPRTMRLRGVTRLASGEYVACGDWGALAKVDHGAVESLGSICGGHLLAIAALADGGAVTVGMGGHALALSPRLEPRLEAVQTTRDLLCVALTETGTPWAGAAQARVLRRSGGSWVRMNGELGLSSSILRIAAGDYAVRAICDDGAVFEGVFR